MGSPVPRPSPAPAGATVEKRAAEKEGSVGARTVVAEEDIDARAPGANAPAKPYPLPLFGVVSGEVDGLSLDEARSARAFWSKATRERRRPIRTRALSRTLMRSIPDDGISSTTSDRSFEISAAMRRVLFRSAAALSSRVELLVRRSPGAPLRFRDGGAAFLDAAGDGRDEARVVAWAGASGASIVEGYAAAMVAVEKRGRKADCF